MKKVLAIIFALVLMLSFAACGDSKDENNTTTTVADVTTTAAAAEGTPVTPDVTEQEEENVTTTAAETVEADTVEADTVEAWIAANQELVDTICEGASTTEDGITITMVISAEGNDLYMTGVISGDYTDEDIAEAEEEALAEQEAWDALTAEEKAEMLQYYVFDETMPVPESVTTIVCDEDANVLAYTAFTK